MAWERIWRKLNELLSLKAWAGLGVILATIFAVVGFLLSGGSDSPPLYNIEILLDRSMSMSEPFGAGTKLEEAARVISEDVLGFRVTNGDNLALRQFGGPCGQENTQQPVKFGLNNVGNIRKQLVDIEPAGETTFLSGVLKASEDLGRLHRVEGTRMRLLAIVGDADSCRDDFVQLIEERLENTGINSKFWVIGMGITAEHEAEFKKLEGIAGKTGVVFVSVKNSEELERETERIFAIDRPSTTLPGSATTIILNTPTPTATPTPLPEPGVLLERINGRMAQVRSFHLEGELVATLPEDTEAVPITARFEGDSEPRGDSSLRITLKRGFISLSFEVREVDGVRYFYDPLVNMWKKSEEQLPAQVDELVAAVTGNLQLDDTRVEAGILRDEPVYNLTSVVELDEALYQIIVSVGQNDFLIRQVRVDRTVPSSLYGGLRLVPEDIADLQQTIQVQFSAFDEPVNIASPDEGAILTPTP